MKILYISTLSSPKVIEDIYNQTAINPGFAVQKFNKLIAEGFINNDVSVRTVTSPPIPTAYTDKFFLCLPNENIDGINISYIPYSKITWLKRIISFIYTFFFTLLWGFFNRKDKVIVCDVLNVSISMAALIASKINGVRSVGIITDMPGLMIDNNTSKSFLKKTYALINKSFLSYFSFFVFLTKQMNEVLNKKKHPFIVMEGIVTKDKGSIRLINVDNRKQSIVYAGGLYEEYGLRTLIQAFKKANLCGYTLDLFGDGSLVEWIKSESSKYPAIVYHGIKPNQEVMLAEQYSTLLINPRPITEEFTLFSFPSKNMEYMLSGTPILTTRLPGMPSEYYPYVYICDREDVDGFAEMITQIVSLPKQILHDKGKEAQNWVIKEKNNTKQVQRIIQMVFENTSHQKA